MLEVCAWADQVFRISYLTTVVSAEKGKTGKIAGRDTTRAIYVGGAQDYRAKSRTLNKFADDEGNPIECIAFENPADSSLWEFIFDEG